MPKIQISVESLVIMVNHLHLNVRQLSNFFYTTVKENGDGRGELNIFSSN